MPAGSFGLAWQATETLAITSQWTCCCPPDGTQPTRQTCTEPTPSFKAAYDALHLDDFVPADRPLRVTRVMVNQTLRTWMGCIGPNEYSEPYTQKKARSWDRALKGSLKRGFREDPRRQLDAPLPGRCLDYQGNP